MKTKGKPISDSDAALKALKASLASEARSAIKHELNAVLGNETVVLNAVIRGNLVVPEKPFDPFTWTGSIQAPAAHVNEHVSKPRRRRSAASLRKQAAAMRRVWREKRKAGKK